MVTQQVVNDYFARLEKVLKFRMLPTQDGGKRMAEAEEFMFMQVNSDGSLGFKHRDTRNYVYLKRDHEGDDYLKIPTGGPFHGGTFDVFDF
jgi:hypothetical protein